MKKKTVLEISQDSVAEAGYWNQKIENAAKRLRLGAFYERYTVMIAEPEWMQLPLAQQISELLDHEVCKRNANAMKKLRRAANLPIALQEACFKDIIRGGTRRMDERLLSLVCSGNWIVDQVNDLIVTGPCGVGKSYIAACAANFAIDRGKTAYFVRAGRLMDDLEINRQNKTIEKRKKELSKIHLLILDDFVLEKMTESNCGDLLDIINNRNGRCPTVYTSQFDPGSWGDRITGVPFAQAILDRIYHSSYRLSITGESQRKDVHPK